MRVSRSLESNEEGKGTEVGVKDEYIWLRLRSADPKANGDFVSPGARCGLSSSRDWGFVRLAFPDDDSDSGSVRICCCGVVVGPNRVWPDCGGVWAWGRESALEGDGSGGAVTDPLPLLGGG